LNGLRPFFTFYGGKWRIAPRYPVPEYERLVEPFAGSAGYSLRHPARRVELYDVDPVIAGLWTYLTQVSEQEIRGLPLAVTNVADLAVPQEAKWLIGFWLNKGTAAPSKTPSRWMRDGLRPKSFWGEEIRERIASQVQHIRHWQVRNAPFWEAADSPATWFIDPPYAGSAGRHYRHDAVDYDHLATWSTSRSGQVIVCENVGASWLPFCPFHHAKALEGKHGGRVSSEAVWLSSAPAGC
jgi:hypothetical protein